MKKIITLENRTSLNRDAFFYDVVNSFEDAKRCGMDVVLDATNIKTVHASVIPKICCLGEIAKNNGMSLSILGNNIIADYFDRMGLLEIVKERELFKFEDGYHFSTVQEDISGAVFFIDKNDLLQKWKDVLQFSEGVTEKKKFEYYVAAEILGENNIRTETFYTSRNILEKNKKVMQAISEFVNFSDVKNNDRIAGPIVQLVHNSVWHSGGNCYFIVQKKNYGSYQKKYACIDVSVADDGCGLYNSFISKQGLEQKLNVYNAEDFRDISNQSTRNYCAILEALYYRKKEPTRGIYDIVCDFAYEPQTYFRQLHLLNGNIEMSLEQSKNSRSCNFYSLISQGPEYLDTNRKQFFRKIKDIGFSYGIDFSISYKR